MKRLFLVGLTILIVLSNIKIAVANDFDVPVPVPEPATLILFASGLAGLIVGAKLLKK